eukprot:Gb_11747 [translate_table: standard]
MQLHWGWRQTNNLFCGFCVFLHIQNKTIPQAPKFWTLPPPYLQVSNHKCDRGLAVDGWANQMQILSQPSTGAFMTHSGWNSSMEGMSVGIPLIALPMQYDQTFNERLIAGKLKMGVEVEKGSNESFSKEQIQKSITNAMVHDSPVRHNARVFRTEAIADLPRINNAEHEVCQKEEIQNPVLDLSKLLLNLFKI